MSPQISEETLLLLMSIYSGLILVLCYDVIRIFRRIFYAGLLRVIVEDVIYWTVAAIFMFNIFLKYNYGRPRFFVVGVTLVTMILFELLLGKRIIDPLAVFLRKLIIFLLKPLKKEEEFIKLKLKKLSGKINHLKKKERKNDRSEKKRISTKKQENANRHSDKAFKRRKKKAHTE